jgi:hypothetical protein
MEMPDLIQLSALLYTLASEHTEEWDAEDKAAVERLTFLTAYEMGNLATPLTTRIANPNRTILNQVTGNISGSLVQRGDVTGGIDL